MADLFLNPLHLIVFLTVITLLVAAHELGHYLFARLYKMEVEEFAIGFGRPRWVFRRGVYKVADPVTGSESEHETEFSLRAFPVGGFVRVKGMEPLSDGSETRIVNGFYSRPPMQRFMVLFAGPLFSVLAGWALLIPLWTFWGKLGYKPDPVIGNINLEGPAAKAGIKLNDRIVSVDGRPVATFFDMIRYVRERPGQKIVIRIERAGLEQDVAVVPSRDPAPTAVINDQFEPTGNSAIQGKLGAMPQQGLIPMTLGEATREAAMTPIKLFDILRGIVGNINRFEREVGGPITMFAATAGAFQMGLVRLLEIAGLLSISLGVFNLLPIPPFDGGQMLMALIEWARRGRRLSYSIQNAIAGAGLLVIATLIISVFVVDINRWFVRGIAPPPKDDKPATTAPIKVGEPSSGSPSSGPR